LQNTEEINRLKNIVQDLLNEATKQGASAAEAGLTLDDGMSVTARLGSVETIEYHCSQGLGVTVYFGKRKGSASSTDISPDSIRETVQAACSIARFSNIDDYAGLPDADRLATEFPDLDLYHPWALDPREAITMAVLCEQSARDYHRDITNSEGATLNTHQGIRVLGNTLNFINGYSSSRHSLSCSVLGQHADSMQRDYWYSVARNATQLESPQEIGRKAAERTIRSLNAQQTSTRQCPVLYSAEVAGGFIGAFIGAISGGNLYRKTSFLLDSLGQQVFPDFVSISEQPLLTNALGSSAYDGEGVTTQTRDIVHQGIVQGYVLSSYSARKLGLQTTGNAGGVHNLSIQTGADDFSSLLKKLDTGLLVTELMGQGVNNVTGDYSRGASGFWVENGTIQYPVEEITIAGNLKDMFKQIIAIGNDIDYRSNIRTGSILIEKMSIAGK
jgi:PmbA protein